MTNYNELRKTIRTIISESTAYSDNVESNDFLQKVKNENPEMFTKFLNYVNNKGLDLAKEKYKEFDKEAIASIEKEKNEDLYNKKLLTKFVKMLPKNLPDLIEKYMEKLGEGKDGTFFFLIGKFIDNYSEKHNSEDADKIQDLTTDKNYEDFFFGELDNKFGKGVIEF